VHTPAQCCTTLTFVLAGKKLVTVSEDGTLIVWDPRSGSPLGKLQNGDARFHFDAGITALAVSTDSRVLLVGGAEGDVRVVNIGSLDAGGAPAVVGELRGHASGESIEAAEFVDLLGAGPAAAPTHAITASTEGKAVVWDLASGKMRCEIMHDAAITTLSLHTGSPLFTTASADHTARTWDARTGALIATHKGFTDGILALAVGPDDGYTQGAETGGIGAYQTAQAGQRKGFKVVCAGDEGVALVFRV
jgi:ribosome assembly protein SQT1